MLALPCLLVRLVAIGSSREAVNHQAADARTAFGGEAFGTLEQCFGDPQRQVLGFHRALILAHIARKHVQCLGLEPLFSQQIVRRQAAVELFCADF
jgi:hypothetical protein